MPLGFRTLQTSIGKAKIEEQGFAFEKKEKDFVPLPHMIHLPEEKDFLSNCCAAVWNQRFVIRSGAVNTRDKARMLRELVQLLSPDHEVQRFACLQVSSVEKEWEAIAEQHAMLHATGLPIAHLCIPIEHHYLSEKEEFKLPQTVKAQENLAIFHNALGWLAYCQWFLEELESTRKIIRTEALDEYVLEARFDDFRREINSAMLRRILTEINSVLKKINTLEAKGGEEKENMARLIEFEKELLKLRYELVEKLRHLSSLLDEIAVEEKKIEEEHPEFTAVRECAEIFDLLLSCQQIQDEKHKVGRVQQLMLLTVLNDMLDVTTSVNGTAGVERTSLAFSIILAMEGIMMKHSRQKAAELARNWEEGHPLKDEFINLVGERFEQFSRPIIEMQKEVNFLEKGAEMHISGEWVPFMLSQKQ